MCIFGDAHGGTEDHRRPYVVISRLLPIPSRCTTNARWWPSLDQADLTQDVWGSPTYFNCIQLQHHHDGHSGSQQSSETQKVAVGHFLTSVQTKLTNTRTEPTKHSEQRSSKRAFRRKFPKSSSLPAWVLAQFFLASRRSARKGCRTSDSNQKAFEKRLWSLWPGPSGHMILKTITTSCSTRTFKQFTIWKFYAQGPSKGTYTEFEWIWYNLQKSTCNTSASIDQQDVEQLSLWESILWQWAVLQRLARLRFTAPIGRPDTAPTLWASAPLPLKTSHGRCSSSGSLAVLCSLPRNWMNW